MLSVINSVCFQMRTRESSGYVLNCELTQLGNSSVFGKFRKFYFQSSLDSRNASYLIFASITSMKIIIDFSQTYLANAKESLANHNDLKSYRLLMHCFSSHIMSKKGHFDLNHVHHPRGCYGVCCFVRFF